MKIDALHTRVDEHAGEIAAVRETLGGLQEELRQFKEMLRRYFRDLLLLASGTMLNLTADPMMQEIGRALKLASEAWR